MCSDSSTKEKRAKCHRLSEESGTEEHAKLIDDYYAAAAGNDDRPPTEL